jgi:hypothetical protein
MTLSTSTAPTVNDPRLVFDAQAHAYTLDGRELLSVTTVLVEAGMSDPRHWTDEARDRGTAVHEAVSLHTEGLLDVSLVYPAYRPYVDGYLRFLSESRVVVEESERRICDPSLGYAGTLDLLVAWKSDDGQKVTRRGLLDIKTGSVPPAVGPQTAAYLRCARAWFPAGTPIHRFALHLPGDGTYRLIPLTNPQDEHDFLAALRVAHFRRTHGIGR